MESAERPDYVKNEHLQYLNDLRKLGSTNMFGAAPYLVETFGIEKSVARKILQYWMFSFWKESR